MTWPLLAIYTAGVVVHFIHWYEVVADSWERRPVDAGGRGWTFLEYLASDFNWVRFLVFVLVWPLVVFSAIVYGIILGFKELY